MGQGGVVWCRAGWGVDVVAGVCVWVGVSELCAIADAVGIDVSEKDSLGGDCVEVSVPLCLCAMSLRYI